MPRNLVCGNILWHCEKCGTGEWANGYRQCALVPLATTLYDGGLCCRYCLWRRPERGFMLGRFCGGFPKAAW